MKILLVEDLPADAEIAIRELTRWGLVFEHRHVDTREAFLRELSRFRPDVVISDYSMPQFDGMQALKLSLQEDPYLPFIILTGSMNESTAVECMKAGATDYVIKSHIARLPVAVQEALDRSAERKAKASAVDALRESEQSFRTLADSGLALIRTTDEEGRCTWFNRVWTTFTGRTMEEETGDGWLAGVHPDDIPQCRASFREALQRGEPFQCEFRLRRHNGEYRWVLDIWSPRYNADGDSIGYIAHGLDITERKHQEEKLRTALEQKETLLRELYHRTRNTIQVIVAMTEIRAAAGSNEVRTALNQITRRILSMSLVHKNLYELQNLSTIDMPSLLEDIRAMVVREHRCDEQGITVTCDLEPLTVSIDTAIPLALVVYELLANAVTHAYPDDRKGEVSIRLRSHDSEAVSLEITDWGRGLPDEFSREGSHSVGLQLAHMIVEHQLQGTLESKDGPGLSWIIRYTESKKAERV